MPLGGRVPIEDPAIPVYNVDARLELIEHGFVQGGIAQRLFDDGLAKIENRGRHVCIGPDQDCKSRGNGTFFQPGYGAAPW